jgi:PKHD-type hydroxylase
MFLAISQVLSPDSLAAVQTALEGVPWRAGEATAGPAARRVKRNEQADLSGRAGAAVQAAAMAGVYAHGAFLSAARPRRISPLLVSRTGPGGGYGAHTDNALMGPPQDRFRADLAFTLFLSAPDAYDGGELRIEDPLADRMVKLPAGDLILYPASSIHEVMPVTRGERLVCVGWVESFVPEAARREILWDLERVRANLPADAEPRLALTLDKAVSNLLREWARG